jgi:hypothetical protein
MLSPPLPRWLDDFLTQVFENGGGVALLGAGERATVCCGTDERDGHTECCVSLSAAEPVGGRRGGARAFCPFAVDVEALLAVFDQVRKCEWLPFGADGRGGVDHLCVTGTFRGRRLAVRLLSRPSEEAQASDRCYAPG